MKAKFQFSLLVAIAMCCFTNVSLSQVLGGTCSTAISIVCGNGPVTYTGSTLNIPSDNATSGAVGCFNSTSAGGQNWYTYTSGASQLITLSTCGSTTNFDTYLSVFTGTCGALTCVISNDDGCNNFASSVTFNALANTTYYVRVGGFASMSGTYALTATCANNNSGCTDPNASNYDPTANANDGSCEYDGCTDIIATNYNPQATNDDGSCTYCNGDSSIVATLYVCAFANGNQINLDIVDSQGNIVISVNNLNNNEIAYYDLCLDMNECYTAQMSNAAGLTGWNNGYFWVNAVGMQLINQSLDVTSTNENALFTLSGFCYTLYGCTDPEAINYYDGANVDDGSCIYNEACDSLTTVQLSLTPGIFANEVSFVISDNNGTIVYQSAPFAPNSLNTTSLCLADGCYTVSMFDSFGDGWNNALLTITANGVSTTYTFTTGSSSYGSFGINATGCTTTVNGGCTDINADNYDPTAVYNDGSCAYSGCTDPNAINYSAQATTDDGSCNYCNGPGSSVSTLYVCTFSNGSQVELLITDDEGNEVIYVNGLNNGGILYTSICLEPGVCYTATMINNTGPYGWYNGYFWINSGGVEVIHTSPTSTSESMSVQFSIDGTCGPVFISGCTDPTALNYNAEATINDGSCLYPVYGCTDPTALNFDLYATADNGSCIYEEDCYQNLVQFTLAYGTWSSESSYNVVDANGNSVFYGAGAGTTYGCLADGCYTLQMFDSFGDGWMYGGPLTITINGVVAGTYTFSSGNSSVAYFGINAEGCNGAISGCTDATALNYNPAATADDGSCTYAEDCTDTFVTMVLSTQIWGSEISWSLQNEAGEEVATSEAYSSWNTYTQFLCLPSGCYTLELNDSWGDGWNGAYYMIYGGGTYAEGSLLYGSSAMDLIGVGAPCGEIAGCTDSLAINYNPYATMNDGTCFYNNNPGGNGLGGGLVETGLNVALYPNPVSSNFVIDLNNLSDNNAVQLSVMSIDGKIVLAENLANNVNYRRHEMNVADLAAGYYILSVQNGTNIKAIAFVKE
jgi:Secretion system C-terminal sorting domain